MKELWAIVEGHGERDGAVPILLRKLLYHHQIFDITVPKPIRIQRGKLVKPDEVIRGVSYALTHNACIGIVVVMDADDDCAATKGPLLREVATERAGSIPVYVVFAVREYESWLLASMDSLKGTGRLSATPDLPPGGPESVRNAKGWIRKNLPKNVAYAETTDQPKFTDRINIRLAYENSASFRKLFRDVADLVQRMGNTPFPP